MIDLRINPALDPAILGRSLQEKTRLQVANFLTAESASHLERLLTGNQIWYSTYNEGDLHFEVPQSELAQMSAPERAILMKNLNNGARDGFQYFFQQYYISNAVRSGENAGHPIHVMHAFVNSQEFLDFMRILCGAADIAYADSFASKYVPGHFLTNHDDKHDTYNRVAAYVLSMTRGWKADWGGNLVFYDHDTGNITEGFAPAYNTLNIFLTPQPHAVTYVAPFAGTQRLSYLGWLNRAEAT
ncbi:proline hydroxylase [Kordiimonas sediminis]|uniref:Proline hydroxylase n=1 Tax=Kordiimonas sediminis TaxID=1735581 RepID=A0A919ARC7_9PROT|nr:2OG-Fe(II) oxygenase family protein [Kordiimonas sediminis]GHF19646.1 proline hydroxylase [Kordiimonas sediminis]